MRKTFPCQWVVLDGGVFSARRKKQPLAHCTARRNYNFNGCKGSPPFQPKHPSISTFFDTWAAVLSARSDGVFLTPQALNLIIQKQLLFFYIFLENRSLKISGVLPLQFNFVLTEFSNALRYRVFFSFVLCLFAVFVSWKFRRKNQKSLKKT